MFTTADETTELPIPEVMVAAPLLIIQVALLNIATPATTMTAQSGILSVTKDIAVVERVCTLPVRLSTIDSPLVNLHQRGNVA